MLRLIAVRAAGGIATLIAASVLVFTVMQILPGNAAIASLGAEAANKKVLAQLEHQYGLDQPVPVRYAKWVFGAIQGDLGTEPASGVSVNAVISGPLVNTAVLLVVTLALMFPLALAIGTTSALRRGSFVDSGLQMVVLVLAALPSFVVGIALILVFAFQWRLFPAVSLSNAPIDLVLPIATLVLGWVPLTARMVRAGIAGVLESDYVQMARLKGMPESMLIRRHVLPNALVPAIQAFALTAASMPAGIVIVEYLFSYQGLGALLVTSVQNRDAATVEAITMVLVLVYVVANLMSDIATIMLTPRLRTRVIA